MLSTVTQDSDAVGRLRLKSTDHRLLRLGLLPLPLDHLLSLSVLYDVAVDVDALSHLRWPLPVDPDLCGGGGSSELFMVRF